MGRQCPLGVKGLMSFEINGTLQKWHMTNNPPEIGKHDTPKNGTLQNGTLQKNTIPRTELSDF